MLVERWFRIIGIAVWLIAGATSLLRMHHGLPWFAAFSLFGLFFWLGTNRLASRASRIACLFCEAVLAFVLSLLGMPGFEGALLAVVAAQVPLVVPVWAAAGWALAQVPALWMVLPSDYDLIERGKSVTAYLGGCAVAIVVVRLFESERRARSEAARQGERVRIARELHDVLGHHLAALSIQLDLARRKAEGASKEPLDQAYGIAHRMLHDVRSTVTALRKDGYDLRTAVEAVVKTVPEPPITLDFPQSLHVDDAACAHVALRCIQEAVTNTVKHADAKSIAIALSREGDDLMIRVTDDGRGGPIQPGNGLRGMRERVEELGGSLDVESTQARGTTLRARLPMAPS